MTDMPAMAAEWLPHRASWISWPTRIDPWGSESGRTRARRAYADIARVISTFEPVKIAVSPADAEAVRAALGTSAEIFEVPIDDGWVRDTGPTFLKGKAGLETRQWRFNAWGGKYAPHAKDAMLAHRIAAHIGLSCEMVPLTCEGGAIHTDGEGTLMATEQTLCQPNRNGAMAKAEIEARLLAATGTQKMIWLGSGFADTETDGHIDNIACFVAPGKVLLGVPAYAGAPDKDATDDARARLAGARDAAGRAIEVIEVEQPLHPKLRHDGQLLPASYINFAFVNGGIILPAFDDDNDERALNQFRSLFPDCRVVQMDVHAVLEGGGGLHCMTLPEHMP